MTETPAYILAQLNDAAKRLATDGSTTYFEQVANRASEYIRKEGGGRRIVIPSTEPDGDPIFIDTSLRTVAYLTHNNPKAIRFSSSVHIPLKTIEAINHYFIGYLEKVARKMK